MNQDASSCQLETPKSDRTDQTLLIFCVWVSSALLTVSMWFLTEYWKGYVLVRVVLGEFEDRCDSCYHVSVHHIFRWHFRDTLEEIFKVSQTVFASLHFVDYCDDSSLESVVALTVGYGLYFISVGPSVRFPDFTVGRKSSLGKLSDGLSDSCTQIKTDGFAETLHG